MSKRKVFIDAGHGGRDPGAVGNGMRESDITLEVALLLSDILVRAGFETRLSRTTDISPAQRWQVANTWGADMLMSIHVNAGGGTGVETLIPTASPNNTRRDLQACRRLAEIISNTLGRTFNMRVRRANGVMLETETRHSSIGVLRNSSMIAVLPEIAFIDSPADNPDIDVLRNRRREVAQALANSVFEFYGISPQQETPQEPAPQPKPEQPQRERFPIEAANVQRMVDLGVIGTPTFWLGVDSVQWLNGLLENAGQQGRLHAKVENGIGDVETALKVLHMAGIMNTPSYWADQVQNSGVEFLGQLIINMANRCLDPLNRIVWAEARGEDIQGQILVVNVIQNRHRHSRFPTGFYNVIFAENAFTPTRNGAYDRAEPTRTNEDAVLFALNGDDRAQGATFFHSIKNSRGELILTPDVWHERAVANGSLRHLFDHGNHRFYDYA